MKVQNENLTGVASPASPAAGRAAEAGKLERLSRFQSANSGAAASNDEVNLSSLASGIVRAGEASAAQSSARVQALAKAYQTGRYTVQPAQLSRKLVSAWLANGTAAKE